MKNPALFLFLLILLISGCTPILRQLYSLEGTWQRQTKTGTAYESWEIQKPNLLLGKGYKGSGPNAQVLENLRLFVEDGTIIYEATVLDQNGGKPVRFLLVKTGGEGKSFIFENPAHDFPQRIAYQLVGTDSLHVRVEDLTGGGLDFGFRRVKD